MSISVEFDQLCHEALRQAGDVSSAVRDRVIADLRLRFEFPGQYVAYLDSYRTVNRLRRLQRRIIGHSTDLGQVQAAILRHPKRERAEIALEFAEPLGEALSVPHDLPFR